MINVINWIRFNSPWQEFLNGWTLSRWNIDQGDVVFVNSCSSLHFNHHSWWFRQIQLKINSQLLWEVSFETLNLNTKQISSAPQPWWNPELHVLVTDVVPLRPPLSPNSNLYLTSANLDLLNSCTVTMLPCLETTCPGHSFFKSLQRMASAGAASVKISSWTSGWPWVK